MPTSSTAAAPLSISVVVPTRDTRDLTRRCLAALAASDHRADEVLLVDDGSRDGTADAVAREFPDVRTVTNATSEGFTAAVNRAWPLATADIVLLLNSDTQVERRALSGFVEAFAHDAALGVAGAALSYPDGRPQWSAGREPTVAWLFALASGGASALGRLPGWRRVRKESQAAGGEAAWVPATAMAVRREVCAAIGFFDPAFHTYAQDLDYCLRARAAGWRVALLPDVRVRHDLGATIGAIGGAVSGSRQDPRALFADLAHWIWRTYPPPQARARCRALAAGMRLRLAARAIARFRVEPGLRAGWDRDTARYRETWRSMASR